MKKLLLLIHIFCIFELGKASKGAKETLSQLETTSEGSDCRCRCILTTEDAGPCKGRPGARKIRYSVETIPDGMDCRCSCAAPVPANICEKSQEKNDFYGTDGDDTSDSFSDLSNKISNTISGSGSASETLHAVWKESTVAAMLKRSFIGVKVMKMRSSVTKMVLALIDLQQALATNFTEETDVLRGNLVKVATDLESTNDNAEALEAVRNEIQRLQTLDQHHVALSSSDQNTSSSNITTKTFFADDVKSGSAIMTQTATTPESVVDEKTSVTSSTKMPITEKFVTSDVSNRFLPEINGSGSQVSQQRTTSIFSQVEKHKPRSNETFPTDAVVSANQERGLNGKREVPPAADGHTNEQQIPGDSRLSTNTTSGEELVSARHSATEVATESTISSSDMSIVTTGAYNQSHPLDSISHASTVQQLELNGVSKVDVPTTHPPQNLTLILSRRKPLNFNKRAKNPTLQSQDQTDALNVNVTSQQTATKLETDDEDYNDNDEEGMTSKVMRPPLVKPNRLEGDVSDFETTKLMEAARTSTILLNPDPKPAVSETTLTHSIQGVRNESKNVLNATTFHPVKYYSALQLNSSAQLTNRYNTTAAPSAFAFEDVSATSSTVTEQSLTAAVGNSPESVAVSVIRASNAVTTTTIIETTVGLHPDSEVQTTDYDASNEDYYSSADGTIDDSDEDDYYEDYVKEIESRTTTTEQTTTAMPSDRCGTLFNLSFPILVHDFGRREGSWMKDPVPPRGQQHKIYLTNFYYGNNLIEFKSTASFRNFRWSKSYILPYNWIGTGHIVYNGSFYYNRAFSRNIIKYNLKHRFVSAWGHLRNAVYDSTTPFTWQGHTMVHMAADESGLWVIYPADDDFSSYSNSQLYVINKINPTDLQTVRIWKTTIRRRSVSHLFIACGVVYAVNRYNTHYAHIAHAYDTHTGDRRTLALPFINRFAYNVQILYNPKEKKLYSWDNGHQILYDVTFSY